MSWFISDLHLGHDSLYKTSRFEFANRQECEELIVNNWSETVKQSDIVYILGDLAMSKTAMLDVAKLPGTKILIAGNHDQLATKYYLQFVDKVRGFCYNNKYKLLLSHCPVHPSFIDGDRFVKNVHGHVHTHSLQDNRYFNVCVDANNYKPISLEQILA